MWPIGVLLLSFVVMVSSSNKFGGSHLQEINQKIASASECIRRLVDCSSFYEPIALGEINGSLFRNPKDLDKACSKNANYIDCLEKTQSFCVMENIGLTEVTMIRNRLWIRDLCEKGSKWRTVYMMHSQCIIRESFEHGKHCSRRLTPINPQYVGLADICRFFKGIVDCTKDILKRNCGEQAADLFHRVSLMKGNREYLCTETIISPRVESPSLKAAKNMLRNVRALMANMSSIVKANLGEEEAAYILQELDPHEIERIKNHFKMMRENGYGEPPLFDIGENEYGELPLFDMGENEYREPPLFDMQDLMDDEDEVEQPEDESIQLMEVHSTKNTKRRTKHIKSQEEEEIAGQEELYAQDWSRRFDEHYKSKEIDWPEESFADASINPIGTDEEESVYSVEKNEIDYSEDESMHPVHDTEEIQHQEEYLHLTQESEVDYPKESFKETEYPVDLNYALPRSHFSLKTDGYQCEDCNESQLHPVRNEIEHSDPKSGMDEPLQLSIFDKSEDDGNSNEVLWEMDENYSCNRLDKRLPEVFKSNASFHVYAVRNRGSMTHMGSGLTMAPWKTVADAHLDDLFCSWLDPNASKTLFKCIIKLSELEHAEHARKKPKTRPILLALYTSPTSSAAEVVSMSEVATICVEDFQPSEEISDELSSIDSSLPSKSKLKKYMHNEDSHMKSKVAEAGIIENIDFNGPSLNQLHSTASILRRSLDTVKVDDILNDETDSSCEKLETKYSIEKRALDMMQEENEGSESFDRNLSLKFVDELPEHIHDFEEKYGLSHNQKFSKSNWKLPSSSCPILDGVSMEVCQIPEEKTSKEEDFEVAEDSFDQPILTDSFVESSDSESANFAEEPDNSDSTDVLTDCKNGNIQSIVGTTIKPGLYAEVTDLATIHPLDFKFGRGCRFAENINYILVEEPYHRGKSTLADSEYLEPETKPVIQTKIRSINGFIGR